jgi:hypothetical protein
MFGMQRQAAMATGSSRKRLSGVERGAFMIASIVNGKSKAGKISR